MSKTDLSKRTKMTEESHAVPRKRRKVVRMAKPSESLDPTEKLTEDLGQHLGIARNRTFNELSTKGKEETGRRLESLLNDVSEVASVAYSKRNLVDL